MHALVIIWQLLEYLMQSLLPLLPGFQEISINHKTALQTRRGLGKPFRCLVMYCTYIYTYKDGRAFLSLCIIVHTRCAILTINMSNGAIHS